MCTAYIGELRWKLHLELYVTLGEKYNGTLLYPKRTETLSPRRPAVRRSRDDYHA